MNNFHGWIKVSKYFTVHFRNISPAFLQSCSRWFGEGLILTEDFLLFFFPLSDSTADVTSKQPLVSRCVS